MFIFVREEDGVIVGCSVKPVSVKDMARQGLNVYDVPDNEFSYDIIGQKLVEFDEID